MDLNCLEKRMMKRNNTQIQYEWEDTGRMTVTFEGKRSASIHFFPSEKIIEGNLYKAVKKPKRAAKQENMSAQNRVLNKNNQTMASG